MSSMGRQPYRSARDTGPMQFRHERVRIETARHEIEGTLQLPQEGFRSRLTDFLNTQGDDFLPLTDAEVTWLDGSRAPERHEYLALATRHVVLVVELEDARRGRAAGPDASARQRRRQAPDRLLDELRRRPDIEPREAGALRAEVGPR